MGKPKLMSIKVTSETAQRVKDICWASNLQADHLVIMAVEGWTEKCAGPGTVTHQRLEELKQRRREDLL